MDQVKLELASGVAITEWSSVVIRDDYTNPVNSMSFTIAPARDQVQDVRAALRKGERVTLHINGVPQSAALIETVHTRIAKDGGVEFTFECQGLLSAMTEGSVYPADYTFRAKTPMPASLVVLAIANPYGFDTIYVDERANRDAVTGSSITGQGGKLDIDALKHSETQAHDGETAYALCARILTRLGVCLRCAVDGTLLLSAPNYEQAASYVLVQSSRSGGTGDYCVSEVEITDTNAGQFSQATIRGQTPDAYSLTRAARPVATAYPATLNESVAAYRSTAAPFKPKIATDKHARDIERCMNVATLALALPARKAFTVTASLDGFASKTTGAIFNVDTIATVKLEAIGLELDLWVLARELRQDRSGGQRTKLTLIPKGFLVLGAA